MNFNLIIAVWGDKFVGTFCSITLPSLMQTNDDEELLAEHRWKFIIYSPIDHHTTIDSALQRHCPYALREFRVLDPHEFSNHYLAMAHAHHLGAVESTEEMARILVVPPDAVFARGALTYIVRVCKAGKRALMTMGPRLRQVTSEEPLRVLFSEGGSLSSRELVSFLSLNIHPEMLRYNWESANFSTMPFLLMWNAPTGWLCRAFHLHPLMIDCSSQHAMEILRNDTIDGEFIANAIGNWDDIKIVQDSDELMMCTLTEDNVFYSESSNTHADIETIRKTAYHISIVNALHRWYATKSIKIHAGDIDDTWLSLENITGHLIFRALSTVDSTATFNPSGIPIYDAHHLRLQSQALEANERTEAVRIVLDAVLNSIGPRALDRRKFQQSVAHAGRETPNEGHQAARHSVLLAEARRILQRYK